MFLEWCELVNKKQKKKNYQIIHITLISVLTVCLTRNIRTVNSISK